MYHTFQSVDSFLFSVEKEIVDTLYDYSLLKKFDKNVKKIIFYFFVKRIGDRLNEDNDLLFYHNSNFIDSHELFQYYDKDKLIPYLNKICTKLKKVTNRVFFLKSTLSIPEKGLLNDLEGSVIDEVLLLKEKNPVDPKELKDFLNKNHLKDLFAELSKKVC